MVKSTQPLKPEEYQLVLEIHNRRAIRVTDLSELFGTMARSYRRMYPGHDLTIEDIRTGSLITVFTDLLSAISGANTIIEFGKSIAQFIRNLQENNGPAQSRDDEFVGSMCREASGGRRPLRCKSRTTRQTTQRNKIACKAELRRDRTPYRANYTEQRKLKKGRRPTERVNEVR